MTKPSTKAAIKALEDLTGNRRQLVVLERDDALTWLSLRNVASVHLLAVDQLNTYDVLLSDDVIFTQGAYDTFVNGTASTTARKATVVEAPANDATVADDVAEAPLPRRTSRRTTTKARPSRSRAARRRRASTSRATRTR